MKRRLCWPPSRPRSGSGSTGNGGSPAGAVPGWKLLGALAESGRVRLPARISPVPAAPRRTTLAAAGNARGARWAIWNWNGPITTETAAAGASVRANGNWAWRTLRCPPAVTQSAQISSLDRPRLSEVLNRQAYGNLTFAGLSHQRPSLSPSRQFRRTIDSDCGHVSMDPGGGRTGFQILGDGHSIAAVVVQAVLLER